MNDWQTDLKRSSFAFVTHVWPEVSQWCGNGRLEMVESSTARGLAKEFDTLAGIDAWQLLDDRGYMRGIASRVQATDHNWQTFTVRSRRHNGAETEFAKRMYAIRDRQGGAILPALTVQGYVNDWREGPLLGAAVARTVDLFGYLDARVEAGLARVRSTENADFYYVTWAELAKAGARVRVWPDQRARPAA